METSKETEHKKWASIGSGIALGATGAAAFTTAVPALTGIFLGTAMLSGGVAAYNYYKRLEDEQSDTNSKDEIKPSDTDDHK